MFRGIWEGWNNKVFGKNSFGYGRAFLGLYGRLLIFVVAVGFLVGEFSG